jgi:CDP-diacylglycerol--glycerol-3-phosphate 3-phosphatidyltransferase
MVKLTKLKKTKSKYIKSNKFIHVSSKVTGKKVAPNVFTDKNTKAEIIESAQILNKKSIDEATKDIISAKTLFNLPNSLTFLRMVLAPFFMWAILISDYTAALIIIIIASLSDFLDGFIARKLNMQTEIGRILDPIADKVLICFSVVTLLIKFNFPLWVGIIIVSRDVILLLGGMIFFYYKKQSNLAPNIFGKISTFVQMVTIVVYIIASLIGYYSLWIDLLLYLTVIMTLLSGIIYLFRIKLVLGLDNK